MKIGLIVLAVLGILLIAVEGFLRLRFGLGNPPLYVADSRTGYRLAPNQRLRRMGNRIQINQYSMRNRDITIAPADYTLRVLLLGDSIANGGWWTDQSQTISQLLEDRLAAVLPPNWQRAEVLNASANSWGPRNELGYVMHFGTFEAQIVIVLLNTDDLFAIAPTSIQVGRDRAYPNRKPPLAIAEALQRWQKPQPLEDYQVLLKEPGDRVGANLEALRQLHLYTKDHHGQLLLTMTPLWREVSPPGSRDYELTARERLQRFTQTEQIPYLDFLPLFTAQATPKTLYRDHIHLSSQGNQLVTVELEHWIRQLIAGELPSGVAAEIAEGLDDPWK